MMRVHRFCSRVSVRRLTRSFQTCQRYASHSDATTVIASGKERAR
jgi:hypothetical protein